MVWTCPASGITRLPFAPAREWRGVCAGSPGARQGAIPPGALRTPNIFDYVSQTAGNLSDTSVRFPFRTTPRGDSNDASNSARPFTRSVHPAPAGAGFSLTARHLSVNRDWSVRRSLND
jgi:hypothetical protein